MRPRDAIARISEGFQQLAAGGSESRTGRGTIFEGLAYDFEQLRNWWQTESKTVSANYTVVETDHTVRANTVGGPITLTLPPAATVPGMVFTAKNIGAANTVVASHGFEDGTVGPYVNAAGADFSVINDPTPRSLGKVAKLHYLDAFSIDKSFEFTYATRLGQEIWVKGDFYFTGTDVTNIFRKLFYWHAHTDFARYSGVGGVSSRVVLLQDIGGFFRIDATFNPAIGLTVNPYTGLPGTGTSPPYTVAHQVTSDDVRQVQTFGIAAVPNTWYRAWMRVNFGSALGSNDGILQVWLDKVTDIPPGGNPTLRYSKTNMIWTDAGWVGATGDSDLSWGPNTMLSTDIYFERYSVGEQAQGAPFNEDRYWDDVSFLTGAAAGGAVTVATQAGDMIDGAVSYSLPAANNAVTIQSNGTGWDILSKV